MQEASRTHQAAEFHSVACESRSSIVTKTNTASQGLNHTVRLLMDFLLHEMVVASLHDLGNLHLQLLDVARNGLVVSLLKDSVK